jgi:hypothetical protein
MIPVLKLPINQSAPIIKGDTFNGVTLTIKKDTVAINLTGSSIKLVFKDNLQKTTATLENGDGITITDAVNGELQIDKISRLDWVSGIHTGDLQITDSNNDRMTYCKIQIEVSDDITK